MEALANPSNSGPAAAAKYLIYWAIGFFLPARRWRPVCRQLAEMGSLLRPNRRLSDMRMVVGVLDREISLKESRRIEIEKSATSFHSGVMNLAQKYAKGRALNINAKGLEHIHAAQAAGSGAILWVCPFSYARLVAKIGLAREDVKLFHLSHWSHGFGRSRVARTLLNAQWTNCENLYLEERLMIREDNEMAALRALRKRVKDNGIVSITFGAEAKKTVKVPFLNGTLTVAAGPPGLALSTGAPILPVYALRQEDGVFDVTVDQPLVCSSEEDKNAQIRNMVDDIANRLGPLVDSNPGQWTGWALFQLPAKD